MSVRQVGECSLWEWGAAVEGYIRANSAEADSGPPAPTPERLAQVLAEHRAQGLIP